MSLRRFTNLLQGLPADSAFWQRVRAEPDHVEGTAARNLLRHL